MISEDLSFHGFGAQSWMRLLTLLGYRSPSYDSRRPTLVIVENADGEGLAAFRTDSGCVPIGRYRGRQSLGDLCRAEGCRQAVVIQEGALDTLAERASAEFPLEGHYLSQWLSVAAALRRAEVEGTVAYHPPRRSFPLPSAAMLERAVDMLLPDDRSLVAVAWDAGSLWTGVALRRRGGQVDAMVGPRALLDWTGPLSGDYRRDHRMINRAVGRMLAPVHIGLYARRHDLEQLLRSSEPGAWLKAVALREVILDPAPRYANVALGADAARAITARTRDFLGGLDLFSGLEPLFTEARERLGQSGSVTSTLGFNPLERLAERLKRADED